MPNVDWKTVWSWAGPLLAASLPALDYLNANPILPSHMLIVAGVVLSKAAHWYLDHASK